MIKNKKNSSRVFLILACVLSFVLLCASAISVITLVFNIGGVSDILSRIFVKNGYSVAEADREISMMMITFVFEILVEMYFALFYLKAIKYRANSLSFARRLRSKAFWHFILGSFIPSIFAIISASIMYKQKQPTQQPINETDLVVENRDDKVPDYKLTAMSEAIARLKELKDKGAISEEEYYANLNRILEG